MSDYGPVGQWILFQEKIFGFTRSRKFIVVTDIANYYDCISYDHLRNILAELAIAKEHSLDLLIYTLSHMLWQPDYMPRIQIGLPQINLDAPRLLAHCFLFEIDRILVQKTNIEFARYMDDMDIGVDSIADAKAVLRDLDLALQTRQIRLNSGKTTILTDSEATRHFRIRDNAFLSRLEDSIDAKLSAGSAIDRERRFLTKMISHGFRTRAFEGGNGEKILKRLINYARQHGANIEDQDFQRVLLKWPSCRSTILLWWQHTRPALKLRILSNFVSSAEIIDDAALIGVAVAVVAARLPASSRIKLLLDEICTHFDQKTKWGFYAKAWILSKYGTDADLISLVEGSIPLWVTEENLSRLVAGLYPRMIRSPHFTKFKAIVARYGNHWSQQVMDFHSDLHLTPIGFSAVRKFICAQNPSQPNKISHSKFLMLCSAISNATIPSSVVSTLRTQHAYALGDEFYKTLI